MNDIAFGKKTRNPKEPVRFVAKFADERLELIKERSQVLRMKKRAEYDEEQEHAGR